MKSGAVYNEVDPFCVEWLRNLITADLIASGDVDDRSILDVCADDWRGYVQVHCFAGIGVWSYSARQAGWPDDRPLWTGSCPCQPFSQAGKGGGFADERHLWPAWHWLIAQSNPDVVLGEQVASKDGLEWFDLVSSDLEGSGYAIGASDQCAAGFGAPHIRQRLWFAGVQQPASVGWLERWTESGRWGLERGCSSGGLSDSQSDGRRRRQDNRDERRRERAPGPDCEAGGPSHHHHHRPGLAFGSLDDDGRRTLRFEGSAFGEDEPVRGFWSGADWLWYRDGKYRPVEAGTFPLASGVAGRVGKLRAYGNALCAPVCQGFIEAVMSCLP